MAMSLTIQHYGRGVAKIPMPRALARSPRQEWLISPSLIIFILACLLILSLKLTMSNKKLLKQTKTIIIIPQVEKMPEPTVPKSIPLIKVLKDAVKKTVEPKKMELKKVLPKKVEAPKPLPKKIESKKIKPLDKLDKKIEPKKLERNELKPKELTPKKIDAQEIKQKKIDTAKPLDKAIVEKKLEPKKLETKQLVDKNVPVRDLPEQPKFKPTIKQKTVDLNTDPMIKESPKVAALEPAPKFNAMNDLHRKPDVTVPTGPTAPRPNVQLATPNEGPAPELTQWQSYKPPVDTESTASEAPRVAHRVATPDAPAPVHHVGTSSGGPAVEDLVIINSSLIGNSDRVKTLKIAIMKKAGKLDPANSPYTYIINDYTCILTIEGGSQGRIIIDFKPANAPFDVVSALERKLPR